MTSLPGRIGWQYVHPDLVKMKDRKVTIHDLRIKCRKFVECSCNGLVLLEDMVGDLNVSNPDTGQILALPRCTQRSECLDIMHGMTFVDSTGEYKVVSFVVKKNGALGCEMLALGSNTWKWVSSPFECLFEWYCMPHCSISIKGVLHIIFTGDVDEVINVVSFDTTEEIFYKSEVPNSCQQLERLHEIDGFPSVVMRNKVDRFCQWDIWCLKDMYNGEWDKHYSIDLPFCKKIPRNHFALHVVATLENGRFLIFERGGSPDVEYHVYDVKLQRLRSLELAPRTGYVLVPHVASLVPCRKL